MKYNVKTLVTQMDSHGFWLFGEKSLATKD